MVVRDDRWSESIAVGNRAFIDQVKNELGFRATHRELVEAEKTYALAKRRQLTISDLPLKMRL